MLCTRTVSADRSALVRLSASSVTWVKGAALSRFTRSITSAPPPLRTTSPVKPLNVTGSKVVLPAFGVMLVVPKPGASAIVRLVTSPSGELLASAVSVPPAPTKVERREILERDAQLRSAEQRIGPAAADADVAAASGVQGVGRIDDRMARGEQHAQGVRAGVAIEVDIDGRDPRLVVAGVGRERGAGVSAGWARGRAAEAGQAAGRFLDFERVVVGRAQHRQMIDLGHVAGEDRTAAVDADLQIGGRPLGVDRVGRRPG